MKSKLLTPELIDFYNQQHRALYEAIAARDTASAVKLIIDKDTGLYHSGTSHAEDQKPHLLIADPDVCSRWCAGEYGNPCQHFCPAGVYEWQDGTLQIHASNCLHCKTCDIKDPYENIRWRAPEGGGGPRYKGM